MSAQVKHADAASIDNKPGERRRGAAGRAAALRRAPSDSDCSGETASLSADSAERRPPPPPPRSGKTRSRRRGSEWEVLEGLKDGQRFERRPEVFNGFLHKKRKWPLKGWHKRFFVVDGGILVYARSPTDVARGRLHGSLDVGLSVISAKTRRRRIDIDADEFIYHLRAKTPDVFRTWLNVLKAHRLYRQHLLTFGARESVPKIHAPTDDLPPTETSSRVSQSSLESFSSITHSQNDLYPATKESCTRTRTYKINSQSTLEGRKPNMTSHFVALDSVDFLNHSFDTSNETKNTYSELGFTNYVENNLENINESFKNLSNVPLNVDEQQMHSTNLDLNTLKSSSLEAYSVLKLKRKEECLLNLDTLFNESTPRAHKQKSKTTYQRNKNLSVNVNTCDNIKKSPLWPSEKDQMMMFLFSHKKQNKSDDDKWAMKKSRKSTNLVRYRNVIDEPCLNTPIPHMIISKNNKQYTKNHSTVGITCDLIGDYKITEVKSTQDVMTTSEYDILSEKLIFNLFDSPDDNKSKSYEESIKTNLCVNQVVKEIYDLNATDSNANPIKYLFKSLFQYYLKNTEGKFKDSTKRDEAITKQSNTYFTRDENMSSTRIDNSHKGTQISNSAIHSKLENKSSNKDKRQSKDSENNNNESHSQNLEELIRNTVYVCTTTPAKSRETDIKITKALIDNLNELSSTRIETNERNLSEPPELAQLQDTIQHLMSQSSLSKAIAEDFLHSYLRLLSSDSSNPTNELDSSSDTLHVPQVDYGPICDIQTESIQKTISKSVLTFNPIQSPLDDYTENNNSEMGQYFFKELVEKMTSLFTSKNNHSKSDTKDGNDTQFRDNQILVKEKLSKPAGDSTCKYLPHGIRKDDGGRSYHSKYGSENVSSSIDAATLKIKGKSKERSMNSYELNLVNSSFKSGNNPEPSQNRIAMKTASSQCKPCYQAVIKTKNPFTSVYTHKGDMDFERGKEEKLLVYSSSDVTISKFNSQDTECSHRKDLHFCRNNKHCNRKQTNSSNGNDNAQSYFIASVQDDTTIALDTINELENIQHFVPGDFAPLGQRTSRIIDEIFILRLLENLTLLSKKTPGIHDEIVNLYTKLKNKHEKVMKNLSRFSLLRSIYGEDCIILPKSNLDEETQLNSKVFPDIRQNIQKKTVQIAINTSFTLPNLRKGVDKALSAIHFGEAFSNLDMLGPDHESMDTLNVKLINPLPNIYNESNERKNETEDEWFQRLTQQYAKNAMIKFMLEKYKKTTITHPIRAKIPEKVALAKITSINDISGLSPPLKISTHSQTRKINEKRMENNSEVYSLFSHKKLLRSESLTDSSVDLKKDTSDELKSIYRCSSDPSYCSSLFVL